MVNRIPYCFQINLREDDFAKAIVEFTSHYLKVRNSRARRFISTEGYRSNNVILKGYNIQYTSYGGPMHRVNKYSFAEYGCSFFPDRLFECLSLIMVFYPGPLVDLALKRKDMSVGASIEDRWDHLTLKHITKVVREQILSFVDIEIVECEGVYNFILEIVYSEPRARLSRLPRIGKSFRWNNSQQPKRKREKSQQTLWTEKFSTT